MYFTVKESAKMCNLSEKTIRRAIDDGELPAVRFTEWAIRIDSADLDAYIENSKKRKPYTRKA